MILKAERIADLLETPGGDPLQITPRPNIDELRDSGAAAIQADSGRYELAQIPNPTKLELSQQSYTPFTVNAADNSVSFAYILNVYHNRSPRNFRDARGFVINDYQNWLEDQWIAELKKKYPVKVEEKLLSEK